MTQTIKKIQTFYEKTDRNCFIETIKKVCFFNNFFCKKKVILNCSEQSTDLNQQKIFWQESKGPLNWCHKKLI